ncbi:rab GTPase-activating protein 22-like [Typha angustifolia]|uniref:rab GTPase-activating protein 22-like n=1 Tax=Typha angustifolia TaxID=59011 RepID=UPI003C2C7ECD
MWFRGCVERRVTAFFATVAARGGGWIWGPTDGRWHAGVAIGVTAVAGLALAATLVITSQRGSLKSPWSRRRRKHALTRQQWKGLFAPNGRLRDGGVKFLKKVRSGGIDPSIRAEVWPFLLGMYNLDSTEAERNNIRATKRKEYMKLRKHSRRISTMNNNGGQDLKGTAKNNCMERPSFDENHGSFGSKENSGDGNTALQMHDEGSGSNAGLPVSDKTSPSNLSNMEEEDKSSITHVDEISGESECSDSGSSTHEEPESLPTFSALGESMENDANVNKVASAKEDATQSRRASEDFATWQRIIRLDAVRANAEWVVYSPSQAAVSEDNAIKSAVAVGLKDYDHLEPCRIYHAARLVAILEAYALYDPEIGYCQGMSDLLSPILAVMEEDYEAFWCFVGFMRKARHNFRLDEVGIRRQLNIVSKIIKNKDSHLYRHLEKLQAEDCFFVYRMVVVMFRRELNFEQTLCLWEVMWADQAANRAGIGKSAWIRLRAPPTDDLLLYAIAASVLQKRKLIIERYSSMDEIIRECNSMAGHLDIWKLLDDAHDLVVILHDKIE